jgi:hypothetical protein
VSWVRPIGSSRHTREILAPGVKLGYSEHKIQPSIDLLAVAPRRGGDGSVARRCELLPTFRRKLWLKEPSNFCRRSAGCRGQPEAATSHAPPNANSGRANRHARDPRLLRQVIADVANLAVYSECREPSSDDENRKTRKDGKSEGFLHGPNENKMSDGWRDGARLRGDGGISWKV